MVNIWRVRVVGLGHRTIREDSGDSSVRAGSAANRKPSHGVSMTVGVSRLPSRTSIPVSSIRASNGARNQSRDGFLSMRLAQEKPAQQDVQRGGFGSTLDQVRQIAEAVRRQIAQGRISLELLVGEAGFPEESGQLLWIRAKGSEHERPHDTVPQNSGCGETLDPGCFARANTSGVRKPVGITGKFWYCECECGDCNR